MLIQFSVANFKSFGEKQTLYMQPTTKQKGRLSLLETGIMRESKVVPAVAMLGANASGKSSFLEALHCLQGIIKKTAFAKKENSFIDNRFKLNSKYNSLPTEFEIMFIANDKNMYTYNISLYPEKISYEKLTRVLPIKGSREVTLIERDGEDITLHSSIYRDSSRLRFWKEETNEKMTYLSSLGNKANISLFDPVLKWFQGIAFIDSSLPYGFTSQRIVEEETRKKDVLRLLSDADIAITDVNIDVQSSNIPSHIIEVMVKEVAIKEKITTVEAREKLSSIKQFKETFIHNSVDGDRISFDIQEESSGTRTLYSYAAPIFSALQDGYIFIVDELERSLHPYLVRKIIQLFSDPDQNKNKAQLIFTTHDVTVMDKTLLHPDQLYIVEKDSDTLESELYCLSEFNDVDSVKKNDRGEKLYKEYLDGRFGGIPNIIWQ